MSEITSFSPIIPHAPNHYFLLIGWYPHTGLCLPLSITNYENALESDLMEAFSQLRFSPFR